MSTVSNIATARRHIRWVLLLSVSGALVAPQIGLSDPVTAESAGTLEEIVVSATRRAENVQNVPIAISTLSAEELSDLRLKDAFAIVSQVPNMTVTSGVGAHAIPLFNLRGVGTNDVFATSAPAVGVYNDDVVANSIFGQALPLFDLDHVEVLRGPQGTLWGKNTTAGAINFISKSPSNVLDGYAQATYGNFNDRELEGAIGGPLIDGVLSARVSLFMADRDGFYFNTARNDRVNDYHDAAGRFQLLWTPTEDLAARLILVRRSEHELNYEASHGILPGGFDSFGTSDRLPNRLIGMDEDSPTSIDTDSATLNLQWHTRYGFDVTSISGYRRNAFRSQFDVDMTPVPFFIGRQDVSVNQVSQEVRLTSATDRRLRWIVGGFYLHEGLESSNPDAFPTIPSFDTVRLMDQTTRNLAAFGNVEFDLAKSWMVRVGVRHTSEHKHIHLVDDAYTPGSDSLNMAQASAFTPIDGPHDTGTTDSRVNWDATLQFKPSDKSLLYPRWPPKMPHPWWGQNASPNAVNRRRSAPS